MVVFWPSEPPYLTRSSVYKAIMYLWGFGQNISAEEQMSHDWRFAESPVLTLVLLSSVNLSNHPAATLKFWNIKHNMKYATGVLMGHLWWHSKKKWLIVMLDGEEMEEMSNKIRACLSGFDLIEQSG